MLIKKIILMSLSLSILIGLTPQTISAADYEENTSVTLSVNASVEELKAAVSGTEGIEIEEGNIIYQDNTSFALEDENGVISIYSLPSEDDVINADQIMKEQRSLWEIVKKLWGIVKKIYSGGKIVCRIVENKTGEDICGRVGYALLQTMATDRNYKTEQLLMKNMSCEPQYSYQCSVSPNVYWKTTVVPA